MDWDTAVVHGNFLARGGGEVVAEELAELFDAPLYYGFGHEGEVPDNGIDHVSLFEDSVFSNFKGYPFVRDLYYMWSFQHVPELQEYDVLVQSGNEPGWYVPTEDQTVVKYVHSTPRAAYDRFQDKGANPVLRLYAMATRALYQQNLPYPDVYVANSELVADRIDRYWGIDDVEVVYPPVDVDSYEAKSRDGFYFTFSRLHPAKNIDEVIRAFEGLDERLIVGGSGPEGDRLREMAGPNVEFRGYLSETEKRDLLGRAEALVFAAENEDFGIVPVEALASGTPVIGVRDGYTRYQVDDGENGVLYDRGAGNLARAVRQFDHSHLSMSAAEIQADAEQYSRQRFCERMRSIVSEAAAERTG